MTYFVQKAGRQFTDFIVPDCWETSLVAYHGVVYCEVSSTYAQLGQAGRLPTVSQTKGILECPFVEVETIVGD